MSFALGVVVGMVLMPIVSLAGCMAGAFVYWKRAEIASRRNK